MVITVVILTVATTIFLPWLWLPSKTRKQGKELVLGGSELNINADEGMLYISMNSANGVALNSTQTIQ
ncbi:hypothetical protein, partial [Paenibacillus fonticola]|uniref:hypothetical protein n=1 Tax=Paenibacillus fonticola TaxID=379896 RepID=UPI001969B2FF